MAYPIILHPTTWLERRTDQDAWRSEIAALRRTLDSTRFTQHLNVKHRADHGRALLRLSQALMYLEEADDEAQREVYNEALEQMEEALSIWQELGRESALHLAKVRVVEQRSLLATLPSQHEAVMHRLTRLDEAQQQAPDRLARPYRATLLATWARCRARAGEWEGAVEAADEALKTLEEMLGPDRTTPELDYLHALREALGVKLEDLHKCENQDHRPDQ